MTADTTPNLSLSWLREPLMSQLNVRRSHAVPHQGPECAVAAEMIDKTQPDSNPDVRGSRRPVAMLSVPFIFPQNPVQGMGNFDLKYNQTMLSHVHSALEGNVFVEMVRIKESAIDAYLNTLDIETASRAVGDHTKAVAERVDAHIKNMAATDVIDRVALLLQLAQLYFEQSRHTYVDQDHIRDRFTQAGLRIAGEIMGPNPVNYIGEEYRSKGSLSERQTFMDRELHQFLTVLRTVRIMAGQQEALRREDFSLNDVSREALKLYDGDTGRYYAPRALVEKLFADLDVHDPELRQHIRVMGTMDWEIRDDEKPAPRAFG